MTGQTTVPYVWIGGEFIGGCSHIKDLETANGLHTKLAAAGAVEVGEGSSAQPTRARDVQLAPDDGLLPAASKDAKRVYHSLFNFPDLADDHVIRVVALQVFAISIAITVLRDSGYSRYLAVGMLLDFLLRLFGGANASPLGVVATAIFARVPPKLVPGPPKQFAVFVGVCFAAGGTAGLWADSSELKIGGAVVWATLAFFAALEGFIGFCMGCWVFGKAIMLGIIPSTIYGISMNKLGEQAWTWDENMGRHDPAPADAKEITTLTHTWHDSEPMVTDVTAKLGKDDAARRRDFNPVKHIRFGFYSMLLSLAGAAHMWRQLAVGSAVGTPYQIQGPELVWKILIAIAAAFWLVFTSLIVAKAFRYPSRIIKEFWTPGESSQASYPFLVLVVFSNTLSSVEGYNTLSRALLWAGAGPMLALALLRVADMFASPSDEDSLNPSWIVAPVGLVVVASAAPRVDSAYVEIASFFYAFALMMWALLFFLMFSRKIRLPSVECRMHNQYYGFVAAPAVAASAYFAITAGGAPAFDLYSKVLLWIAFVLYLVLGITYTRSFLGNCCFSMMEFAMGFPTVKLAQLLLEYNGYLKSALSQGLAISFIIFASFTIAVLFGHFLTALLRGGVFRNNGTWFPLQASNYFDEAIVSFIRMFKKALEALEPEDIDGAARLAASWSSAEPILERQLATHKDSIIFPAINEVAFGAADEFIGLNGRSLEQLARAHRRIQVLLDARTVEERQAAISELRGGTEKWLGQLEHQLIREREVLYPIVEKLVPLRVQKHLLRKMWDGIAWSHLAPWTIKHLPNRDRRVRLLRAIQWAMPERLQTVGLYVARGVDSVMWTDTVRDIPALIPRGMLGYVPYY